MVMNEVKNGEEIGLLKKRGRKRRESRERWEKPRGGERRGLERWRNCEKEKKCVVKGRERPREVVREGEKDGDWW